MPVRLFWSSDNGQLYPDTAENAEMEHDGNYAVYEVPDRLVFTPSQLCVQDGDILEALLRTRQAKLLRGCR